MRQPKVRNRVFEGRKARLQIMTPLDGARITNCNQQVIKMARFALIRPPSPHFLPPQVHSANTSVRSAQWQMLLS